ncbi:hypothetical protein DQ04_01751050 [Trypanosoma grayi]|uniref:hypothetical protein n=1 Tax=Trypanosoma grayi TaxID=71804 RepID=UPI0004F43AB6|nr:hypothetical protein DQ04_01751050 [Trypanosoma grayi]KEG12388.1 hypothetical protein DQ04_01751050 [Trypanosoma grayi]
MASEAPPNEWETPPPSSTAAVAAASPVSAAAATATTGVYAANRVSGTYLKTLTGVQRGEELFHRPDLERPWRTSTAQKHAVVVALKEKEIEELLRKCSSLRTQLGNARHDAKYMEYAITEKCKVQVSEIQREVERLEKALKVENESKEELKTSTEHQIRLLRTQHEKDLMNLRNENRLLQDRCAELTKIYQQQVDDVKKAASRELEHIESLCNSRVVELTNELKSARVKNSTAEERHAEEMVQSRNLINRIETDYKERIREAEQRVDDVRTRLEAENKRLDEERGTALREARHATEQLAVAIADREEVLVRFKQWDAYILRLLDRYYSEVVQRAPECAVEPHDAELHEAPFLYAPRNILEDPDAKVTVERIVYRLLQLKHMKFVKENPPSEETNVPESLDKLGAKQERLTRAMREIEGKCIEAEQSLKSAVSRLYFFSNDLEDAIGHSGSVAPPQTHVVFVCISVFNGNRLWADDAGVARSVVSLMNSAIRPKMAEYGAYECYSDGLTLLLAFNDPVAACRFAAELQWWMMQLPWPQSLLRSAWGKEEYDEGNTLLFRGLRLSMAVHTGEAFVEPTAIPCGNSYRCHYYGRAVSQVIHTCSLAQGGQVLVTKPVWDLCISRRDELGALVAREVGTFPIVSFNKETNSYEREPLLLHQILPQPLRKRRFEDLAQEHATHVMSLAKMRRSIVSAEIECVEARRTSLKEAIGAAHGELLAVDRCINALTEKARQTMSYFHLLPPSEMVTQMNELYGLMEKIASRASELRDDVRDMDRMQEELGVQTRGLKEYCARHGSTASREEELRLRAEMAESHYDAQLQEMRRSHAEGIERLQRELSERDQLIQRLYRDVQRSQKR